MRPTVPDVLEKGRIVETDGRLGTYPGEWYGRFVVLGPAGDWLLLMTCPGDPDAWASFGFPPPAFDHVSVSVRSKASGRCDRCPIWEEMAWVKDLCWEPEEAVVQYHPPRSRYVNYHPHVLHLWKPVGVELPLPPAETVGPLAAAGG